MAMNDTNLAKDEQQRMEKCGFGPYPVSVIPHLLVPVSDGTKLAVKLWVPQKLPHPRWPPDTPHYLLHDGQDSRSCSNNQETYPVILEYLPYRKSDMTMPRDHRRHAWMTSQGYVCARVDMRGCGDSKGLYFGEYLAQEQQDACDIIHWLASQPWCNGKVGMYGKSWGGANGLQVAYEQPPALAAVISLYSMDDRFRTDVHWDGGCVLAQGMLSWASRMFSWNCSPPSPYCVPDWKQEWQKRLERASESWCKDWLSHQSKDEFWKHGSIDTDYSRVKCPVLAVGGWRDAYTDCVFRMVDHLPCVRGIIGPWSHDWPDIATPGPNIEFRQLCLQWWDYHLKDKTDNGAMSAAKFRCFIQESSAPEPGIKIWPGRWICKAGQACETGADRAVFVPNGKGILDTDVDGVDEKWVDVEYKSASGQWCGLWLCMGHPDGPLDQQIEDGLSQCWTSTPLDDELCILGFPSLETRVRISSGDHGCLAVRLCDVAPSGQSTLITYGLLNLAHRLGHDEGQQEKLVPGHVYSVTVQLHSCGYALKKSHRLRMCVSSSYWPQMWPSANTSPVSILIGSDSSSNNRNTQLILPLLTSSHSILTNDPIFNPVGEIQSLGPNLPSLEENPPKSKFSLFSGFAFQDNCYVRILEEDSGIVILTENGKTMEYEEKVTETYSIREEDPLSAKVSIPQSLSFHYPQMPEPCTILIKSLSEMTCSDVEFIVKNEVEVSLNDAEVYSKQWMDAIKREFV